MKVFSDARSALLAVSKGEVFCYIGNIATYNFISKKYGITNLKVSGETPYSYQLSLGVRKDWPELIPILQKALNTITEEEKLEVLDKWYTIEEESADFSLLLHTIGLIIFILIALIYWNRKLHVEILKKQESEESLKRSKEIAENYNQAKTTFLTNMSHEIRTPLNSIIGHTQILQKEEEEKERKEQSLVAIQKSGEHLLKIINDLLDMAKIEHGKIEINKKVFSLKELLVDLHIIFSTRAEELGIKFFIDLDNNLPERVIADEVRVRQILINLLGNAIKFTEEGFVKLEVQRVLREKNLHLKFIVTDSGIGIEESELENIFLKFEQIEGKKQSHGAGLGLPICFELAKMMGSEIFVRSEPKKGSQFWFELRFNEEEINGKMVNLLSEVEESKIKDLENIETKDLYKIECATLIGDIEKLEEIANSYKEKYPNISKELSSKTKIYDIESIEELVDKLKRG